MPSKTIYDSIHGYITLSSNCMSIINTPEFHRLRNIKQMGPCYYVFPGASHNRFEHSLGVAHLAKTLIINLKRNQPELKITKKDIENVEIAGLCHDLGHGPYSHLFDEALKKIYISKYNHTNNEYLNHEKRSCIILRHIVLKYKLDISDDRLDVIENMIVPKKSDHYLFQIVANKETGLDVDKFDYISRDTHRVGLHFNFDCSRIISQCRVINNQLCFLDKDVYNIYELFSIRYRLHKQIYTHHTVVCLDLMFGEILEQIIKNYKIIDILDNPSVFCKYTDTLFENITNGCDYRYINARNIIKCIQTRKLYKYLDQIIVDKEQHPNSPHESLILKYICIGFNKKGFNPVNKILFYNMNDMDTYYTINKEDVSCLLPEKYNEHIIKGYCTNIKDIKECKKLFDSFKIVSKTSD